VQQVLPRSAAQEGEAEAAAAIIPVPTNSPAILAMRVPAVLSNAI
jgi:hypothetical protein